MDFKPVLCLFACMCSVLASESLLESTPYLSAYMDHQLTLPCKYGGSDWIMIRWFREVNETYSLPLATMTIANSLPQWQDSAPEDFKNHVEIHKESGDDGLTFDLIIDGFMCEDVGTFVCEVITPTNLVPLRAKVTIDIKAHPEKPTINPDIIESEENSTFNLECFANVGKPATDLQWSYKLAGEDVYQMIKNVSQTNSPSHDCTFDGVSQITVEMTQELDGARFMCYTSPDSSDEVLLELSGKTTTTTTVATTTFTYIEDDTGRASNHITSCLLVLVCVIVSSFTRTFADNS